MKKIKLLFRNRSLEVGGAEKILLTILHHLDRSKYDITLVLNFKKGEFINQVPNDINLLSITTGIEKRKQNKLLSIFDKIIKRIEYYIFQKFPIYFYKKHQLEDVDYEIAFSHYMIPTVLKSPLKNSKKVFWFHGNLLEFDLSDEEKYSVIQNIIKFDKGVFVSNFSKQSIEKKWNLTLTNSTVIYNPIDTEEIIYKSSEQIDGDIPIFDFISIGRMGRGKGFHDLIDAHHKLSKEGYKIKTAIIGSGEEYNNLMQQIEKLNIQDSFFLLGFQSNPLKFLKHSKYFILPSYTESYPTVIAEALSLGIPVLSTNVGGIPEMVVNEKEGFLFEPGFSNLFCNMKKVLDNDQLYNFFKQNCATSYQKFNLEHQLIKVEEILSK